MIIRQLLDTFHPRSQPWITRQSYCHELLAALTFPVAMGMIEGSVVGVLARKTFEVGPLLFATIMAAPMFANVTSFVWARLAQRRRKVRFINTLQIAFLGFIGAIALLPIDRTGGFLLTGLIVLNRCFMAGIITIRSTIWRMNYPRQVRGQVIGRLTLINSFILAIAPLLGYALLDQDPEAFRLIYPASLLIASIGVVAFSRVRLRGERELLAFESRQTARPQPHGTPGTIYEYDPRAGTDSYWTVLRQDHLFRRYMMLQFFGGMANMMGDVVMIYLIAEMTKHRPHEYLISILLTTAIPMLMATLTLPAWARYFDRVHVIQLRARQGVLWQVNQLLNWISIISGSLVIIAIARIATGVNRGGGVLAWNLGHNDFADRRLVSLYMGIHLTLTGIRGALGPFVAMMLYLGWSNEALAWLGLTVPSFDGIHQHVFLVTAGMAMLTTLGFFHLKTKLPHNWGNKSEMHDK